MKNTFTVLLLLLCACRAGAQTAATVSQLTVNSGLSQGMIFDILQSRDGFLWIATNDGLNRYDGSRFEVFSPDPFNAFSISGSEVTSLFEDHRGLIWISLPSQLEIFDPKSRRFFHVTYEGKPVSSQEYAFFAETSDGAIWLIDDVHIWKIILPKGMLEKAATTGVATVEPACKHIALKHADGRAGPPLQATRLFYSKNQQLLIGTNQGLFRLAPATETVFPECAIPDFQVRGIAETTAGEAVNHKYPV